MNYRFHNRDPIIFAINDGMGMKRIDWLVIGLLLLSPVVLAEAKNPYIGTWNAEFVAQNGKTRKGTVVLEQEEGTWDMKHQRFQNPCSGKPFPIVIKKASAHKLVFKIYRSRVLSGCTDHVAVLKPVNDKTLQGETKNGLKITLVRE